MRSLALIFEHAAVVSGSALAAGKAVWQKWSGMRTASCPTATELQTFVAGGATAKQRAAVTRHMDKCRLCELIVGELMLPNDARSPEDELRERFELIREVGRGGTSVVFEARPRNATNKRARVAIKLLKSTSPLQRQRFDRREAPLALRASLHPAFVRVHEVIKFNNGQRAIVMELLDGSDLETYATQVPLGFSDILDILGQLAEAVAWLHAQGIVHRDLTTRNVWVQRTDSGVRVRVLDLGFARDGDAENATAITASCTMLGTPSYMAPEQKRGEPADSSADVWGLAMIAVRLLTGTCSIDPSDGDQTFNKHPRFKSSPTWRRLVACVPPEFARLIERSLSHDRTARPQALEWVRTTKRLR